MLYDKPLCGFRQTSHVAKVNVFALCYSDDDLQEFKANQCVVVVVCLLHLFKVGCLEVVRQDALVYLLAHDACHHEELKHISHAEIGWGTIFGHRTNKDLFYFKEVMAH